MSAILVTPPALEPLTVADARQWLRVDGAEDDALISALIASARTVVEREAGQCLIQQGWRISFDAWPYNGVVGLPLSPVTAISAVRVMTASGLVTVSASNYRLEITRDKPRLWITGPVPQPEVAGAGIEIDLTCGYGVAATDVPEALRQAMRVLIAHWFEHRGDGLDTAAIPPGVAALVGSFRRPRV